mgnify:CR=1 FL=1
MKTCSKCGEAHPTEFFNKARTRDDGLHPWCKTCSRAACRRTYKKHRPSHMATKQRWKRENADRLPEINRQWRLANPDKVRAGAARYRERIRRATPPWADVAEIKAFYDRRPEGHHVDHIHPLAGANFCGLNVMWNLQYLPAAEHRKKGTKLLAASGGCDNL